jgi:hypothetical protein
VQDYWHNLCEGLKQVDIIQDLTFNHYGQYLKEINVCPNLMSKHDDLFPRSPFQSSSFESLAQKIHEKFNRFYNFCVIWKTEPNELAKLIQHYNFNNHYFNFELLFGLGYTLYTHSKKNELLSLEEIMGRLFGCYCYHAKFNCDEICHTIQLLIDLGSHLYFPDKYFANDNLMEKYFKNMIKFYYGFFSPFSISQMDLIGEIWKNLFTPIKTPMKDIDVECQECVKILESLFFSPLMEKLKYLTKERAELIEIWDVYGFYREYLLSISETKLLQNGFSLCQKDTQFRSINKIPSIAHIFKKNCSDINAAEGLGKLKLTK